MSAIITKNENDTKNIIEKFQVQMKAANEIKQERD